MGESEDRLQAVLFGCLFAGSGFVLATGMLLIGTAIPRAYEIPRGLFLRFALPFGVMTSILLVARCREIAASAKPQYWTGVALGVVAGGWLFWRLFTD